MDAKIVRNKGKTLSKILRSVKALNNQKVEVGHFKSQGVHYSGMTYPELLLFWFVGVESEGASGRIRQDVRSQFVFEYFNGNRINQDPLIKTAINDWSKNAMVKGNPTKFLDTVGKILRDEYKTTFNVRQGPFMNGTVTPLFETGELAEATAYRTSKSKTIKEG